MPGIRGNRADSGVWRDFGYKMTCMTVLNRSRHYRIRRSTAGRENLFEVLTVREASGLFCVSESTIRYAIETDKIAARQNGKGKAWLISKQSLIDIYGHSPLIRSKKLHDKTGS